VNAAAVFTTAVAGRGQLPVKAPVMGFYGGNDARERDHRSGRRGDELGKPYTPHIYDGAGRLPAPAGPDSANMRRQSRPGRRCSRSSAQLSNRPRASSPSCCMPRGPPPGLRAAIAVSATTALTEPT
jgi:hypothetical protein